MTEQLAPANGGRVCLWCPNPIPEGARADSKFCHVICRKRSWRFTNACLAHGYAPAPRDGDHMSPYTFAYADPPYPGKADYYNDQPTYAGEVDHRALIERLLDIYPDGWALSTDTDSLAYVLKLCPNTVRVGSWHRRVRHVRAAWPLRTWEPLVIYGGRPYDASRTQTVLDRLTYEGRYQSYPGALIGMKPPEFCVWMLRQLHACRGDRVDDLFPGSGAVSRAWAIYSGAELTTVPRIADLSVA